MAEQDTGAPVAAPVVFDPPHIYLHKDSRVPPLPVYTQTQADALPPEWMSPDVWNAGGGGGGGGAQTPWTSDIDAAGYNLNNATNLRAQYLFADNVGLSNVPQFTDLAAAQAALGAGSGVVWRDPNNALFVA